MGRQPHVPEWPRWFRLLCYGLLAAIVLGMTARTLADASSTRDAVQGLGGIALLCLWLGWGYVAKTRWRDRDRRSGLALLACLAITVGILAVLAPGEGWLNREFLALVGIAVVFALALVVAPAVSLSRRVFGLLVSGVGVVLIGFEVWSSGSTAGAFDRGVLGGAICLLIGVLYAFKPDAMAKLETEGDRV